MENLVIDSQLPVLSSNFELVKKDLANELEKYNNVVVTLDTLPQDKKLAKEIKSKGKAFDTSRKEKVAEISVPIKHFESQMKELKGMCDDLASTIEVQVKKFEQEKLEEISKKLEQALTDARQKSGVIDEFFGADMHKSLVKLTAITKAGNLTKPTQSSIDEIVASEKSNMQLVALRIAQLEAKSYEAGLEIPIAQVNVNHFILASDEEYSSKLTHVIQAELQRQEDAQRRRAEKEAREIAKREAIERAEQERKVEEEQVERQVLHSVNQAQHHQAKQEQPVTHQVTQQSPSENISCMVQANFMISVPQQVTDAQIQNKLSKMLEKAGITSLSGIKVIRNVGA